MKASDIITILPEIILLVVAMAVLMVEAFLKPRKVAVDGDPNGATVETGPDRTVLVALAVTGFVASAAVSLFLVHTTRTAFSGMLVLDRWAVLFKVLFAVTGLITVLMSSGYLESHRRHMGEYYALIMFAVIGLDIMVASRDFIAFYVAFELMSIASYLLAAYFRYRSKSNEAALKYFLTGSFASAIMLYGISLVYGITGTTNYSAVLGALKPIGASTGVILSIFLVGIGLAFKVSAAPFHMWTPDVYQGAPTPVTAFFSVGPKAAALGVAILVFPRAFPLATGHDWGLFFLVLSILTMLVGNVFALVQTNVKRMLAYSSIAHAGYLLAGLAAMGWSGKTAPARGMVIYLVAYTFMNLGAFSVLTYLKSQNPDKFDYSLKQFAGLGRRNPWAGVLLSLFLLSLTGIPGTAGFIGKLFVFSYVVNTGLVWLAVIAVVLSAVSAFYYLRVIVYMFFREPEGDLELRSPISGSMSAALAITAIATLVIGVYPSWLWNQVVAAVNALFS
jgi:NADH-quinone oxidoreductase subunit N